MNRLITLFERDTYDYASLGLNDLDAFINEVERLNSENGADYLTLGRKKLQVNQFVGVLMIGDTTIQVLPKIDHDPHGQTDAAHGSASLDLAARSAAKNFIQILFYLHELKLHPTTIANLETARGTWNEILISLFCAELTAALQEGSHQDYIYQEEQLPFIRGRWDIRRQYSRQPDLVRGLEVSYDDYSLDTLVNRVFRFAVWQLRRISRDGHNLAKLSQLDTWLEGVSLVPAFSIVVLDSISFNRLNERFKPAFDLAKMLIQNLTSNTLTGSFRSGAIMFDMDVMFERFISKLISNNLSKLMPNTYERIKVVLQGDRRKNYLLTSVDGADKYLNLIPDISLQEGQKVKLIIDTKNKNLSKTDPLSDVKGSDAYQMLAYATHFQCDDVLLLYPRTKDGSGMLLRKLRYNKTALNLYFGTLNLHQPLENLTPLIEEIKQMLLMITRDTILSTEEKWQETQKMS